MKSLRSEFARTVDDTLDTLTVDKAIIQVVQGGTVFSHAGSSPAWWPIGGRGAIVVCSRRFGMAVHHLHGWRIMFVREYGLVHNPSDSVRYTRLVKWEPRWLPPDAAGFEVYTAVPTVWEWTLLDVSNPRAVDYAGPVWKQVPTAITELPMVHWRTTWPSDAPTETESVRRERIRALRRACHVDRGIGAAEPQWREEQVRAVA